MMRRSNMLKIAALAAGLAGLSIAAGCAPAYCDGYYCRGHGYYYHRNGYHDSHDYYRHEGYRDRHRVCDSDGDDCHWSYER